MNYIKYRFSAPGEDLTEIELHMLRCSEHFAKHLPTLERIEKEKVVLRGMRFFIGEEDVTDQIHDMRSWRDPHYMIDILPDFSVVLSNIGRALLTKHQGERV